MGQGQYSQLPFARRQAARAALLRPPQVPGEPTSALLELPLAAALIGPPRTFFIFCVTFLCPHRFAPMSPEQEAVSQ